MLVFNRERHFFGIGQAAGIFAFGFFCGVAATKVASSHEANLYRFLADSLSRIYTALGDIMISHHSEESSTMPTECPQNENPELDASSLGRGSDAFSLAILTN